MSFLFTETNGSQAKALVVSDSHVLAENITAFFRQANFQVEEWGRASFLAAVENPPDFDTIDKIVVILLGDLKETVGEIVSLFKNYQSKLLVIAPYALPIHSTHAAAEELVVQTKYIADLTRYLRTSLPETRSFFLQDVYYPKKDAFYFEQWLNNLLQPSAWVVFDHPEIDIYPQSLEEVAITIRKNLFAPSRKEVFLVRGQPVKLHQVAKLLQQAIEEKWQESCLLQPIEQQDSNLPSQILSSRGLAVSGLVQQLLLTHLEFLDKAKNALTKRKIKESLSVPITLPENNRKMIYPPAIPKIENRMKKYEKKMAEVAQRKKNFPKKNLSPGDFPPGPVRSSPTRALRPSQEKPVLQEKRVEERVLDEEIKRIFGSERVQKKVEQTKQKVKTKNQVYRKNKYRSAVLVLSAAVAGIGLGLAALWGSFWITKQLTFQAVTVVAQKVQSGASLSDQELQQLSRGTIPLAQVLSFEVGAYQTVFGANTLKQEELLASIATEAPGVYQLTQQLKHHAVELSQIFFGQQQGDSQAILNQIGSDSEEAYKQLSLLQNQVKSYGESLNDPQQLHLLKQFENQIQEQRKLIAVQLQLQQVLPSLLGFQGRQTYAVLLQNNQELRPTGGFLQTVALLTIEKGVLIDSQVFDVSALDKSFAGQVIPPSEVQAYLGEKSWFLRDANWDPDFPQTAKQVQWFLEKMTGKKVDGVVGINLFALQSLLKQTGPLSLSAYNETLTDQNFLDKVEFHSEIKLVDSEKTEYLSAVFSKLLSNMTVLPEGKILPVLGTIYENIRSGQAAIYVDKADKNALLSNLGWGGEIATPQCPAPFNDQTCVVDTFFQVEANIGVNKANYALNRKITHQVSITADSINHQRTIVFANNATSNAWPLGAYKTYIRFYVPEQSSLQEIKVNNTILGLNSIITKTEHGKKYFGVALEVPAGQSKQITLMYSEPLRMGSNQAKLALPATFSYVFFEQKQPGTTDDPYLLSVQYPTSLHPAVVAPQAEVSGQSVTFTSVRDKNLFMGLKFN